MQATVAAAFDYRIRFLFGMPVVHDLVAYQGAVAVRHPAARDFFASFGLVLNDLNPVGRVLDRDDEERLARFCIVLAWFEQSYRGGDPAYRGTPLPQRLSTTALLEVVSPEVAAEVAELGRVFYERNRMLVSKPTECNPTFDGSAAVGGADADLIIDHCLLELKCRERAAIEGTDVYQLIGYTLLDFNDRYRINAVAVYLARHGIWLQWALADWLDSLSPGLGGSGLASLREEIGMLLGVL